MVEVSKEKIVVKKCDTILKRGQSWGKPFALHKTWFCANARGGNNPI